MIPFSNHPLYRIFWGWMGAPEVSLLKLFQGPVIRKASVYAHVVQESIMPIRYLPEGIKRFDSWYGVYPLLVFPLRVYDRGNLSGFLHPRKENLIPGKDYGIWVDLGAYGAPRDVKQGKEWNAKKSIREMEHWTRDIGGWQAYYTDIMCTKKEFREMYDHSLVDKCRQKLKAEDAFPEVSELFILFYYRLWLITLRPSPALTLP
jgi:Delta24-sterol reductase